MRHEDAGLALWVAGDHSSRERTVDCTDLEIAAAAHALQVSEGRSIRQRAGAAVIALGERLAGDARPMTQPVPRRRFAGQG
jgi:hypothetical protein